MAVELCNRLEAGLERPLRTTLIFDFPRVDALTQHLADEVLHLAEDRAGTGIGPAGDSSLESGLDPGAAAQLDLDADPWDRLSGEELAGLVDDKLAAVSRFLGEDS
jgi:hypothetical protein